MATPNWIGNATPTVDTWTGTLAGTFAAADTVTITHTSSGKTLVITVGAAVATTDVALAVKQAFQSETMGTGYSCVPAAGGTSIPEMAVHTASVSGSVVTIVSDTSGADIGTYTMTESTAGSGTFTGAHSVTATGPSWFTNTSNSSTGSLPVSTDHWTIDRPVSILYGLAQSAITLASQTIGARFTQAAHVGLIRRSAAGYEQYLATELALSATTWTNRSTSGLIKQNFGSVQVTANNYSSGTTAEAGRPAVQLRGTDAGNVLNVYGGDVGWGANNETATLLTCRQESGTLTLGTGVTLGTFNHINGLAYINCAATTILSNAGTLWHYVGGSTTVNLNGGSFHGTGTGTYGTVNQTAGDFRTGVNITTTLLSISGGSATLLGPVGTVVCESGGFTIDSGNVTAITVINGVGRYNGTGIISSLTLQDSDFYFDGGSAACTVSAWELKGKCRIFDVANRVVWSAAPTWQGVLSVSPT